MKKEFHHIGFVMTEFHSVRLITPFYYSNNFLIVILMLQNRDPYYDIQLVDNGLECSTMNYVDITECNLSENDNLLGFAFFFLN